MTTAIEDLKPEQMAIFSAAENTLAALESQLQEQHPDINNYLREINHQLRQFPELLYLLSAEQRSAIYRGLIHNSEIEIVKAKAKKAGSKAVLDDGRTVLDLLGD